MKVICFCHQLNCFGFENCKQSEAQLFTRCSLLVEVHSLLVTRSKITRYLLQKLLVARIYPLLVPQVARCKNSLATRCKIFSLLVAEKVTHCKKSLVSRCEIRLLLVATNHLLLYEKHHSPLVKTILSP